MLARARGTKHEGGQEEMTETPAGDSRVGGRSRLPLIAGALAAVALAALLVVLLTGDDGAEVEVGKATEVSAGELREFARDRGGPVYWAGEVPGQKLELTENERDYVYVRYLPDIAPIGDQKPSYTTVATYPVKDAFAVATRQGEARGRVEREVPGGGVAVYYRARATSVYLAFPGQDVLVEVYDPQAAEARALALSGRVLPIE
jgi:hypothetical protein